MYSWKLHSLPEFRGCVGTKYRASTKTHYQNLVRTVILDNDMEPHRLFLTSTLPLFFEQVKQGMMTAPTPLQHAMADESKLGGDGDGIAALATPSPSPSLRMLWLKQCKLKEHFFKAFFQTFK